MQVNKNMCTNQHTAAPLIKIDKAGAYAAGDGVISSRWGY